MSNKTKKTNLVRITARTDEEMQELIDTEQDEALRLRQLEVRPRPSCCGRVD